MQSGCWISYQMVGVAPLKEFLGEMNDISRLLNSLPRELEMTPASEDLLYEEIRNTHQVEYTKNAPSLTQTESNAYNVVVLGPTGCGKSTIINQIFNKFVCPTGANAFSITREVRFYHGILSDQKTINIIDTVGTYDNTMGGHSLIDDF